MQNDNQKNTVIFFAIALVMLAVYQFFVIQPQAKRAQQARAAAAAQAAANQGAISPGAPAPPVQVSRAQALAASPRIPVATPSLQGSIALKGARIDDLFLVRYRETTDPRSPPVELMRPEASAGAFYSDFGWYGANLPGLPNANTVWTAPAGARLTPQTPVTLTYRSPQGLVFTRTISVDQDYMFTVADTLGNGGGAPVSLTPYGSVVRDGVPPVTRGNSAFQGAIGWLGKLHTSNFKDLKKKGQQQFEVTGGWLGITDKYWLAALIPDQHQPIIAHYRTTSTPVGDAFDATFSDRPVTVAPGRQITVTHRLFAGAKTVPILHQYEQTAGVPEFGRAIDWGVIPGPVITRPVFWLLEHFYHLLGNFGLAILLLTVCVRAAFFWPSNKSYESMTKMKKVQPELEKLRKRNKDDPAKQQQEMMQLYQREKINPVMGCLPVLATIPVFLALYKVLSVTIEMRHAPFFGWIKDLSAPDPSNIWNLFGLIPWDPSTAPLIGGLIGGVGLLHLGVWAITYGVTMWMTQSMSPQTGIDPMQAKMMQLFPLVFTFVLAQFAVGLLIYYTWSNILGIAQQYIIMRRFKVDNPIDQIIRRLTGKPKPAAA